MMLALMSFVWIALLFLTEYLAVNGKFNSLLNKVVHSENKEMDHYVALEEKEILNNTGKVLDAPLVVKQI